MNLRELAKKSAAAAAARGLAALTAFLFTVFYARWLGPAYFGGLILCIMSLNILSVFSRFGMENLVLKVIGQQDADTNSQGTTIFFSAIRATAILSLTLTLFITWHSNFITSSIFKSDELYFPFVSTIIALGPFSLSYMISEGLKAEGKAVYASFIQTGAIPLLAIAFGLYLETNSQLTLEVSTNIYLASSLIVLLIGALISNSFTITGLRSTKLKPIRQTLKMGAPFLLINSSYLIMTWTDILVLGIFLDNDTVGLYSAASRTVLVLGIFLMGINSIVAPKFASYFQKRNIDALAQLAQLSSTISLFTVIIPALFLIIYPELVLSIYGNEFIDGAKFLIILTIGQLVNAACGPVGYLLSMTGHERESGRISVYACLFNIILSCLLVYIFGATGAAASTALSISLWNIWSMAKVKSLIGFWSLPILRNNYRI